jgi:AraC-like DNA-binding protein
MIATPYFLLATPEDGVRPMNALMDVLRTMRLTGGIFLDCDFTAPWCVTTSAIGPDEVGLLAMPMPAHVIAYHYVTCGSMLLQFGQQPPVSVGAGEIVVFPTSGDHKLGSDLDLKPIGAKELVLPPSDGNLARIDHGGGGPATHIMCGFLGTDTPNDPLIELLPDVLKLGIGQGASANWIESSLRFAAQEMVSGRPGSFAILAQLAEALFMEAVRRYVDTLPQVQRGWLAGLRDPVVGRALTLLHAQKDRRWTADELASETGLSRSAFAERFTRVMGEPPMRYLAKQRMRFAAQRLRTSHETVARIAFEAGYESEAAFNRAFKRELGVPPAIWRGRSPESQTPTQ